MKQFITIIPALTALLISLLTFNSFAQSFDTVYVHADSIKEKSISLNGVWRYHPGDDMDWASPGYDVSTWDTIKTIMVLRDMPEDTWQGIGWFRKVMVIDSSLRSEPISFSMDHYGASQFYLNGKLVHEFGKVGNSLDEEEIYQPDNIPFAVSLDTSLVYNLAVRYSNYRAVVDKDWFDKWFRRAGFRARIDDINTKIEQSIQDEGITFAVNIGLSGLFLSLAILYFILFLFYSGKKENLYYFFFTLFIAVVFTSGMLRRFVHTDLNLLIVYSVVSIFSITLIFTSYLGFLYSIFYKKMPKQFWLFLSLAVLIGLSLLIYLPEGIVDNALMGFIFISTVEGLRVIIVALKRGKDNAWVVGIGVIVFVLFVITLFVLGLLGENINNLFGVIMFFVGLLSLPISMSVYLAKDIATTNNNLEKQLVTVKELSEKELEHQKKTAELTLQTEKERAETEKAKLRAKIAEAENERKTKELEEARQLQLSMLPQQLPQLHNVDIAVYMKTATEVGGDYYDFHVGLDGTFTAVIGDATGHGLKAGTMVTTAKSLFNSYAADPDIIKTFGEFTRVIKDMKIHLMSMCLSIVKINGNKLRLSSAGMPPALLYRNSENKIEEFILKGMPLGAFKDFPYKLKETEVHSGDTLLLLSDGLPELFNKNKEMFGYEKIKEVYGEVAGKEPEEIIEHLKNVGSAWAEDEDPNDDVTFVVLKFK